MQGKKGFTIVEIMVTVAIIATLATIVTLSFNRQLVETRDSARLTNATLLAAALEKYYDEHGEYPSPRALVSTYSGNTGDAVATVLSVKDKSTLVMPNAATSTTNSIATALGSSDLIAYVATSGVGNDNCQTNVAGGCDEFTLTYKKEADGSTVTIESTYKGRPGDYDSPLKPSDKPILSVVQSGTNLVATSTVFACPTEGGLSPSYSFRERIAAGSWLAWGTWQTSNAYTRGSNVNTTMYSFQVQGRCASATNVGDISPTSDPVSVTYYLMPATPTVPTVNATISGTNVIGTSSIVTCNYGNDEYRIDSRTNSGTWATNLWGTGNTASVAGSNAVTFGYRSTARCVNGTQTATSAAGVEDTVVYYAMPATPAVPTMNATTSGTNVTGTSSTIACNYGSAQYLIDYRTNSGAWVGGAWGAGNTRMLGASNAVNYGFRSTGRCVNNAQVATSATGAEDTILYYATPATPGTPTINGALSGANVVGTSTTIACNYGTAQYLIDYRTNDGAWAVGAWGAGNTRSVGASDGVKYGFRVAARCVNNTQIATTGTSAEDAYIDPIAAPAAPGVSGATYSGKNWTWSASACPAGTWATYQYAFLTYSGSWVGSGWIGAGTGTNATNAAATSQGIAYDIAVHQNCASNYTSSGWSADTWGAYFYVPVVHVQVARAAIRLNTWTGGTGPDGAPDGTFGGWETLSFTGTCAAGTSRDMALLGRKNWSAGGYIYENVRGPWDMGSYNPATNGGAPENGKAILHHFLNSDPSGTWANSRIYPANSDDFQMTANTRCRNTSTGYMTNVSGQVELPALYYYGTIYSKTGGTAGTFNIGCKTDLYAGMTYYCSGGYNSGGTSTAASLDVCTTRAYGSMTSYTNYYSDIVSAGGGGIPRCWSTNYAAGTW